MNRDRRLERLGAIAGILGPVLLAVYLGAPAVTGWPFSGAPPDALITYALAHELLSFAGGWLQATDSLLSSLFFLMLLQLSDAYPGAGRSRTMTLCPPVLMAAKSRAPVAAAHAGRPASFAW